MMIAREQKAAVLRYHEEGMNRRDIAAVTREMSRDVAWWSVDGDFERRWYSGVDEIVQFLAAMFENTDRFEFTIHRLLSDPDTPDVVVAEWENKALFRDGGEYENRGCTVFVFASDTSAILEVRQYFDWGPLMARADWRASARVAT
jgi:ketosteroid isomerase-like protein